MIRINIAILLLVLATPARAQDAALDLSTPADAVSANVEAEGIQLHRLPFSFHLRTVDKHPWGLRITFPVSFTALRMEAVSDVGDFVKKLGLAAIIPGAELEIPLGGRTLLRPFGEVGIGKGSASSTELFYGIGVRANNVQDVGRLHVTYGGSVAGRKAPDLASTSNRYGAFEAGADVEVPLGFSIGDKGARGGVYVIGRAFDGLELERIGHPPAEIRGQTEVGVSFSTTPTLRVWKVPLRWLAAGYTFGRISGARVYLSFPF
jgi:hypothetical protein